MEWVYHYYIARTLSGWATCMYMYASYAYNLISLILFVLTYSQMDFSLLQYSLKLFSVTKYKVN